ncbi:dermonecrotic toxin domain-containing protein [Pseudomonas atagonensis]|uniref:dermonecrotic toxin domain-containing protein n=1 Tax=Pseudomonas atagonensis TaxID=2609964 RepID=UPI00140794FF|nr:DUF6543 domain-containing protein [Pseudomonas atagonensis]
MSEPAAPLLFAPVLNAPGLWKDLGKIHHLSTRDFQWLQHTKLATHALRSAQTPPMLTQRIVLNATGQTPVPLAGSFLLSHTPDDPGVVLYTPYDGIKKYASLETMQASLQKRLNDAGEDDDLLAFLSLSERKQWAASQAVQLTFTTIEGDLFDDQSSAIKNAQHLNAQAIIKEFKRLPALASLLDQALADLLKSDFSNLPNANVRVGFYREADASSDAAPASARHWLDSMSLGDAVLRFYRHQRWVPDHKHEFYASGSTPAGDQATWEQVVKTAASKLPALLFWQLEQYWNAPGELGSPRRAMFAKALQDQARAELMLRRESQIIDADQFETLHQLLRPATRAARRPTIETVHLWEHQPNAVELAGSLMISHANAYLYTPLQGLQVLKDYPDLKDTLLSKFSAAGHEDELYSLLSLEERQRFIGFDRPHVSGETISGEIFQVLLEKIITKQRQNIEYALQVFRHSDGAVDIHALFDKSLDIRPMLHERLSSVEADGRWSTRPVFHGGQLPSMVLAEKAAAAVKTYTDVETPLLNEFSKQPLDTVSAQRTYLEAMKPRLAHALFVGVRGEARFATLSGVLKERENALVETVFNADLAARNNRAALNGFLPDVWSLTLECSGEKVPLPLAHCVLITERGGLDNRHSGQVVLWTPAGGLEVFDNVNQARRSLSRRLLDSEQRLGLLENLAPSQHHFHRRYTLGPLRLIEGNVLHDRTQSAIDRFLDRCEHLRSRVNDATRVQAGLSALSKQLIETNLRRAAEYSRAIHRQQTLPAWLGMASREEQQTHLELLEQWAESVIDGKDYLHGIKPLTEYVEATLKSLLDARFPGSNLDPLHITITPNLALAGPAGNLAEFALNHVNVAQGTGFTVSSSSKTVLPTGLDQQAVRQLLLSLAIPATFVKTVVDLLSADDAAGKASKECFVRQLPWQLLQHAHALKLQQRLSVNGFDLIRQILDMPDGLARASVVGAHAQIYPLSLIKTVGAAAVEALGLYVIGPGKGHEGPRILYTPYAEQVFHEFEHDAGLVAALNVPGELQNLLLRRLPDTQQSVFRSLFKASLGQSSEISLAVNALTGNVLHTLFSDNIKVLKRMLGTQTQADAQADWEAVKHLFTQGIRQAATLLPGKLAYLTFLWQSYKDFKTSADALQDHHWKRALKAFIAGAVQMLSLGRLSLEEQAGSVATSAIKENPQQLPAPHWKDIRTTAALRTGLQPFESTDVALKDLTHNVQDGTYRHSVSQHTYAAIAGKVYRVERPGAVWRLVNAKLHGPTLWKNANTLVLDPDRHTVHFGKLVSKMYNRYANTRETRMVLNIEAHGMEDIRRRYPDKARALVQAIDLARYYAFNSLHNLAEYKIALPGTRVDTFLKAFFDVPTIDVDILARITKAIVPICTALVDPTDELMNTDRFVIGSNKFRQSNFIAFVLDDDQERKVHFTEAFFDQQLDWYKAGLTEPFNVDGHAQASTLIHEFAHQCAKAVDIASLEARRPFSDLISTVTGYGSALKHNQETFQREALSMATPREELFARWNHSLREWVSLDVIPGLESVSEEILDATLSPTIEAARNAFFDQQTPYARVETILRNADSIALLICQLGRQLDPVVKSPTVTP